MTSVDRVSVQAAADLIDAAEQTPLTLATLIDGASAGGAGLIFGATPELDLTKDKKKPAPTKPSSEAVNSAAAAAAAASAAKREAEKLAKARLEAERKAEAKTASERRARELAERRLRLAEERARRAELRAKQAETKAQQEQDAQRQKAAALANQKKPPQPAATKLPSNIQSLQVVEALLGRAQRRNIQRRLQSMKLYNGQLDAIFGDRTREAIKAFQRKAGAQPTGYLTPDQLQQITAKQ